MSEQVILASASPQRKTLLEGLGVLFVVIPSAVDEACCLEKDPAKRAVVLSELKARDVAAKNPDTWVIGSDTLVVAADGTLLEKAQSDDEARMMIEKQSGKASVIHSGLCLIDPTGKSYSGLSSSRVLFRSLTKLDIDSWIESGLWKDRSGSFQIDGKGQLLIEKLEGDWTSVVGLPVYLLGELCRKAGATFLS